MIAKKNVENKGSDQKECGQETAENKNAWNHVLAARDGKRPHSTDYFQHVFDGFLELHGDRLYGDDRAVIGGIAAIDKIYVTVIGQQKGRTAKENQFRNYGMLNPEGYRKVLRLMKQADKFGRPIILFVDTPGAFCGVEAEERGQGEAIARNLFEMSGLKVPILTIITGEGGSGGALAMAVSNEVWMLENSIYSILSPEGFAAILWKDGKRAKEAAEVMKITAKELKEMGIVEEVITETSINGNEIKDVNGKVEKISVDYEHMQELTSVLKRKILEFLKKYEEKTQEEIRMERYERFRRMGKEFVVE